MKDSYNTAADPDSWPGLFTDEFVASIESLDLAVGDEVTLTLDDRACGDPTAVLTGHKLM